MITATATGLRAAFVADSPGGRFARGGAWLLGGAFGAQGLSLAASIITARLLDMQGFGELAMIQSTIGMFGVFAGLGLGLTTTKYVAEYRRRDLDRTGRIIGLSALAAVIGSVVCGLAMALAAPLLAAALLHAPQLTGQLRVASAGICFGALAGAQTGTLMGLEAFRAIAQANIARGLLSFPILVVGAWAWGLSGAVAGAVVSAGIGCLLNEVVLRRESSRAGIIVQWRTVWPESRILWDFSLPAFLSGALVGPVTCLVNSLLARQSNGYAALGVYNAADRWRLALLFVPTSVGTAALPLLSHFKGMGDASAYRTIVRHNVLSNLVFTAPAALLLAAFSTPVMSLFGASYRSGSVVVILLSFSAISAAMNTALGQLVVSAGLVWHRLAFDLLLAVMVVTVSTWLIPERGAIGLALANLTGYTATAVALVVFVLRSGRAF